ncbi:ABC transporter ATP-binding protein [Litoribacter alkaliphilus]|uniref:ABC transporter ATP-binding protein n=1 Tax=Litoribacter ruber TaxID=702568 RepID=A0AAP2G4X5_9BACT|nr:ABC transporter ATP-binding protein [Litoribacter alkaliphilus]MBS9524481.1 ABC transporter ATP-binding protein [Litoribacter alkaliphilus]
MISIGKVNKKFGKFTALNDLTLELELGKSYALVGPNGSGKTTLIKTILGLVIPTSGDITIQDKSILKEWAYREKIGYMPQIGRYPENMTIGQVFEMIKNIRKHTGALDEELIQSFELEKMYGKRMHTLSGGTRQKVSAALAFLFNPPILILDEPTAGLDPVSVEILKDKILKEKESGKLVIITSHIMSDLDDLTTDLVYLFEGDLIYNDSIKNLKKETGETKLGKAISCLITQNKCLTELITS